MKRKQNERNMRVKDGQMNNVFFFCRNAWRMFSNEMISNVLSNHETQANEQSNRRNNTPLASRPVGLLFLVWVLKFISHIFSLFFHFFLVFCAHHYLCVCIGEDNDGDDKHTFDDVDAKDTNHEFTNAAFGFSTFRYTPKNPFFEFLLGYNLIFKTRGNNHIWT